MLMKNAILAVIFFLPFATYAQDTETIVNEPRAFISDPGDFGVTINASGLINNVMIRPRVDLRGQNSILFRYNVNENIVVRMGLAPTIMNFRGLSTDSVGKDLVEFDSTARQASFSFRPGVEFHFNGTNRLDPYVAIDGEAGLIGKFSAGAVTSITDTTGTATYKRTITEAGGYSLGAKANVGMNYFLVKNFALGLEYGMGVYYLVTGGDKQEVLQSDPVSGVASAKRELSSTRNLDTQLFVDPTVQLTISYYF